jgi:hypothetical protein
MVMMPPVDTSWSKPMRTWMRWCVRFKTRSCANWELPNFQLVPQSYGATKS